MFKIKPSLRLYFLGTLLFLGISTVSVFTAFSLSNLVNGMDFIMENTMDEFADIDCVEDGKPVIVLNTNVASRWQDVPRNVRSRFSEPPTDDNNFFKDFDKDNIFEPPSRAYFVVLSYDRNGYKRYISRVLMENDKQFGGEEHHKGLDIFLVIIFSGVLGIGIFSALLVVIMRRARSPMQQLGEWAKDLDENSLQQTPPDFYYAELNSLATLVHGSLNSVQQSLDREHEFLRNASHELRTPIAVVCANAELLTKLQLKENTNIKQQQVLARIERAGLTMSDLTETLLWLSRDNSISLVSESVNLAELVKQVSDELQYLLVGKEVEVGLHTDKYVLDIPVTACRIVLSNLIRNAFQHTQVGTVYIEQIKDRVMIRNVNQSEKSSDDLGFGLGLKLADKLVERFAWQYETEVEKTGHKVCVAFGDD